MAGLTQILWEPFLIAMKLRVGRKYKNDLSDIIDILAGHEKWGNPININDINATKESNVNDILNSLKKKK